MERISIDELPQYSPWVERLLHLKPFSRPVRDLSKIDAEYEKDKYAKLLTFYTSRHNVNISDIRKQEALSDLNTVCFSKNSELFLTLPNDILQMADELLIDIMAEPVSDVKVIIELGCGYGYNLSVLSKVYPNRVWLGGEYSRNAVQLASYLFADDENISVLPFNYYDNDWDILESLEEKALIFTRHSIEQLPLARSIIPTFARYKEKISQVLHLEPVYELLNESSTLGLMRQAYTLINDYNTDLLTTLNGMGVQILDIGVDLLGTNPLNPTCLIRWKFPE